MEPRLVERPAVRLVGVAFNPEADGWDRCPAAFYDLCRRIESIPHRVASETLYGYIYSAAGNGPDTYVAGVEVSAVGEIPAGTVFVEIPAGLYAMFVAEGGMGAIGPTFGAINAWLATAPYCEVRCGAVEVYGPEFRAAADCRFEIGTAVAPKGE